MWQRLTLSALLAVGLAGITACAQKNTPGAAEADDAAPDVPASIDIGKPLYEVAPPARRAPVAKRPFRGEPVEVPDSRLIVFQKQDVPAQHDGVISFIGTEVGPNEAVPPELLVPEGKGVKGKRYRVLREGDVVQEGQLLAMLDDRYVRADAAIKEKKLSAAKADQLTSVAMRDEFQIRADVRRKLLQNNSVSQEEYREAVLGFKRYAQEAVSKEEAIGVANEELNQAKIVLDMFEIKASIPGQINAIYKRPGEGVKSSPSYEPLFQIHSHGRLRAVGQVDVQYTPRLKHGMKAVIEPAQFQAPQFTFVGHLQEVTGVAVGRDQKRTLIVSGSEDGSVRVWEQNSPTEVRILRHGTPAQPLAVKSVACTPPGAPGNWCLAGTADGTAFLWDLDDESGKPRHVLKDGHRSAVTCVAFSPDGRFCATGGEDREINVWDPAAGKLLYRLPAGHKAAVTSLQFTPQSGLVSAGKDSTALLWALGQQGGRIETPFPRRSGDVDRLGVSPDGKQVLFDQGRNLRLLSLPDGRHEGMVQNPAGAGNFSSLALFSPDARLLLTATGNEGRLQLWRAPVEGSRAVEVRQLVASEHAPVTCGDFSPDGKFLVTGTKDRQVMLWTVPPQEEIDREIVGEVTLVEHAVEGSASQVKIWAEVANPDLRLLPGTSVTMVIYPEK